MAAHAPGCLAVKEPCCTGGEGVTETGPNWTPRANQARDYERYLVPAYFRPFAEELTALIAPWPGERVLDVACGTGALTRLLAQRVGPSGHVTGLDISPGMLAVARSLLDAPHVDWQEASALAMPFLGGTFDLVTCQQGLQSFSDHAAGMAEMRRVLKPRGRLALSCWRSADFNPVWKLLEEALRRLVGPAAAALPPLALGDADELRQLARAAGFTDVTVRIDGRLVRFPSPAEFVRRTVLGAPTMLGALAAADADAHRRLMDEATRVMTPYIDNFGLAVPLATHILLAR